MRRTAEDGAEPRAIALPGGHELLLTRRTFLYGAAGAAALAALGGGAAFAAAHTDDKKSLETLTVPEANVVLDSS